MMNNKKNLIEIKDQRELRENLINLFKVGFSCIPLGSPLASLFGDYLPSRKIERLETFIQWAVETISRLEEKVYKDKIDTDEFGYISESCLKGIMNNYSKIKIQMFKGILINSLVRNKKQEEKEFYLHLINRLTEIHLKILAICYNPKDYFDFYKINVERVKDANLRSVFLVALKGIDEAIMKTTFEELFNLGLLSSGKTVFGVMESRTGLDLLNGRLTKLGYDFIDFCMNYEGEYEKRKDSK